MWEIFLFKYGHPLWLLDIENIRPSTRYGSEDLTDLRYKWQDFCFKDGKKVSATAWILISQMNLQKMKYVYWRLCIFIVLSYPLTEEPQETCQRRWRRMLSGKQWRVEIQKGNFCKHDKICYYFEHMHYFYDSSYWSRIYNSFCYGTTEMCNEQCQQLILFFLIRRWVTWGKYMAKYQLFRKKKRRFKNGVMENLLRRSPKSSKLQKRQQKYTQSTWLHTGEEKVWCAIDS